MSTSESRIHGRDNVRATARKMRRRAAAGAAAAAAAAAVADDNMCWRRWMIMVQIL